VSTYCGQLWWSADRLKIGMGVFCLVS
jgi:hypothetical protein